MSSEDSIFPDPITSVDPNTTRSRFSRLERRMLFVLLVVSVVLNVLLARKINQLTSAQNAPTTERQLKVGTQVPVFQVTDLTGQLQTVAYDHGKPTVLYIFTPSCSWCIRNMDNLNELVTRKSDEYRFIGLALEKEGLSEYAARYGLTMLIYTGLSNETLRAYKIGGTPQTIVVSPEGMIIQNWNGAYTGDQQKQVELYFGINLPGIRLNTEFK